MIVKKSTEVNIDFIHSVLELDQLVYQEEHRGTYESVMDRYQKNKDSMLLLIDHDQIIGYICYFPISHSLVDQMMNQPILFDDNITSQDIIPYRQYKKHNLFIISFVIHPAYQGKNGIKYLIQQFKTELNEKVKNQYDINRILASAVSVKGQSTLIKLGLTVYKQINQEEQLYVGTYEDIKKSK